MTIVMKSTAAQTRIPQKPTKHNRFYLIIATVAIIVIASAAYVYLQGVWPSVSSTLQQTDKLMHPFSASSNTVQMKLPAIGSNDTGVSAVLTVTVKKGTGNIYFGINNALSNPDTQQSARTAALYATNHENVSLDTVDISYDIRASASMIEGPSAGAAFAVSTIAALRNETMNSNTMITGAINHDGTIGPAGKILEKAKAAKEVGAKLFLAPVGSHAMIDVNYTEQEFCHTWGGYNDCQPEYVPVTLNASKEAGVPIVEVATVDDALKYFQVS